MLQGIHIHKVFPQEEKNVKKKKKKKIPQTLKKDPSVLNCQTLSNSSIFNYLALTRFPRAAVGSCPGCTTTFSPHRTAVSLSCPQHRWCCSSAGRRDRLSLHVSQHQQEPSVSRQDRSHRATPWCGKGRKQRL